MRKNSKKPKTASPKDKYRNTVNLQHATKYHAMLYVFFSSVFIALLWALARWAWIEWNWLPKAKLYIPQLFVPFFLSCIHIAVCRNFIKGIADKVEKLAWYIIFILSLILFVSTGMVVEKKKANIAEISAFTPTMASILEDADYIHANVSRSDIDTYHANYYFDASTQTKRYGKDIVFHLYEVCPLHSLPHVYVAHEVNESHDFTYASKESLDSRFRSFVRTNVGAMRKEIKEMHSSKLYLKHMRQSDNIEGFQHAVQRIYKRMRKDFNSDEVIIYKIEKGYDPDKDVSFFETLCLGALLLEAILLAFGYSFFYVRREYEEAYMQLENLKSQYWKLRAVPLATILFFLLPVLMLVIFVLMLLNGYNLDSSNKEMFINWGALNKTNVLVYNEWWRLITYGFLHDGIFHLAGNLFFYGISAFMLSANHSGYRILLIFLVSTVVAGIFSLLFSGGYCVGASGGVFGLMAFWVGYELFQIYINHDSHASFANIAYPSAMLGLNILLSFGNGISMSAHLGGMASGLLLAVIYGLLNNKNVQSLRNLF